MRPLLSLVILPVLLTSSLGAQGTAAGLDSVFAEQRGTDRPGCAVSVVQRGRLVLARGFGMSDLSQGLAISPTSVFHVASVSKQFTAMSLVLLAQAGKLSLDDEVRRYLPDFPAYDRPITIRQFLSHTSGVRDQWNLLMTAGWRLGDDLITEQDVVEIVNRQRTLNFTPGSSWNYSNTGFTLAGAIVRRVTGQSLRAFADSAIFRPLGMRQTHFHDDNLMIVPARTRGYTRRAGEWKETVPNYSTVGATSLFTTVVDLARWQQQLDSGFVGGTAALATLTTPAVLTSGDTLAYALGIARGRYRGVSTLSHSGGDPGYSSHLLHFPATGSGVSVLCNSSGVANPTRLAELTADAVLGDELGPVPQQAALVAPAALEAAAGLYWSEAAEASARLVIEDGATGWRVGAQTTRLRDSGTPRRHLLGTGPASLTLGADGSILHRSSNGESASYVRVSEWTPSAAERSALVGRYYSPEVDVTWEVTADGDSLVLRRRKFPPARLTPITRDTYTASSGLTYVIRAVRGRDGRITGLTAGSGRVRAVAFDRERARP
ncbi:MAG: beta-lactamase family protein [Gemmatimonadetes bacterium]|nr:beta-lactamase family protein [Gemmatimonadota bacterium]